MTPTEYLARASAILTDAPDAESRDDARDRHLAAQTQLLLAIATHLTAPAPARITPATLPPLPSVATPARHAPGVAL